MKPFSILMFIFSGVLFLYAAELFLTKNFKLIMRYWAVDIKNKKAYTTAFAKTIALVAVAPLLSGVVGLFFDNALPSVVLIVGIIIAIVIGANIVKKVDK